MLGEVDAVPAGRGHQVDAVGAANTGQARPNQGLGISRSGSPDRVVDNGRQHDQSGAMDAQQQLQANRLDYNQAEIERRDEEIANIEQTVDGA